MEKNTQQAIYMSLVEHMWPVTHSLRIPGSERVSWVVRVFHIWKRGLGREGKGRVTCEEGLGLRIQLGPFGEVGTRSFRGPCGMSTTTVFGDTHIGGQILSSVPN